MSNVDSEARAQRDAAPIIPDHAKTWAFLDKVHPGRLRHLTVINKERQSIQSRCFAPDAKDGGINWLDQKDGFNCYWSVNEPKDVKHSKLSKEDIKAVHHFHIDIDPREGFPIEIEQQLILARLTVDLPVGVLPPTFTIFSGGGCQAFWTLSEPFQVDGDHEKIAHIERYIIQLEERFRAKGDLKVDSTHDISRIMRLPFTVNNPDAAKIKRGRVRALTSLLEYHPERVYSLDQFEQAPAQQSPPQLRPDADKIEQVLSRIDVSKPVQINNLAELDIPDRLKIIIAQGKHPDPEECKSGDNSASGWVFDVVCNLPRFGVKPEVTYGLITDTAWGISEHVFKQKNWQKYAIRQVKRGLLKAEDPTKFEQQERQRTALEVMNEKHFALESHGGKFWIAEYKVIHGYERVSVQTVQDFKFRYANKQVETMDRAGKPCFRPVGDWWLQHAERRSYHDVELDPNKPSEFVDSCGNLILNRWKGLGVQPKQGDWSLFRQHLRSDMLQSQEAYDYFIGWLSRAVQRPGDPIGSVMVFTGSHGNGKSLLLKWCTQLFGAHGMTFADPTQLTDKFQGHLIDGLLLAVHEASALKNKNQFSKFKSMITEARVAIEAKRKDTIEITNRMKVLLASNEADAVTVSIGDRRVAVFGVSDAHTPAVLGEEENFAYFAPIIKQMEVDGGLEAMLFDLLQRDVSCWIAGKIPNTIARNAQKLATSLTGLQEVLLDILQTGEWFRPEHGDTSLLRADGMVGAMELKEYAQQQFPREKITVNAVSTLLVSLGFVQNRNRRPTGYTWPPLTVARTNFDKLFASVEWNDEKTWHGEGVGGKTFHQAELDRAYEEHRNSRVIGLKRSEPF